jgi:hypothetical protein
MQNHMREWLLAALCQSKLPQLSEQQFEGLIAMAGDEAVLLLLEQQLHQHPERESLSAEFLNTLQEACRPALFDQLAMLAEQHKVFEALQQANVDFLVLKGGALAHWLYAKPHLRVVTDLDILLPNKQAVLNLNEVLAPIAYSTSAAAGELITHEHPYVKQGGPYGKYTVDAHWRLFNGALLQDRFDYAQLRAQAIALPNLTHVLVLSPVHALFNACGHHALNLPNTRTQGWQNANCLRWIWDIHALALHLTQLQWQEVVKLCQEKQMSAVLLHALSLTQSLFKTELPEFVLKELSKQQKNEAMSMQWFIWWPRYQWQVFLASSPHWRGRMQWLKERVWPNPEAMRERYGKNDPVWKFMFKRLVAGIRRVFS